MGSYRLSKLSKEAEDDLVGIHRYGFRTFGERQADAYFWRLIEHFEMLSEAPLLGQDVAHIREGYRRSVCGAHSIYYRLHGSRTEIMAILRAQDVAARL